MLIVNKKIVAIASKQNNNKFKEKQLSLDAKQSFFFAIKLLVVAQNN